jgi:hypothetical protein
MKFREIVSINGMSGLYQLLTTKSDGAIVKNIEEGSTKFVAARKHTVTALDGIEVFTTNENMRLFDVFLEMKNNEAAAGELVLAKADNKAMTAYFGKLFPEFDKDRVYVSDMKKMVKWFRILNAKDILIKEETTEEEQTIEEKQA